ncbi:tetratricopeptide repeat-containing sensor histidine kinase [Myroides sp. WP-1]|uniref:ATP-binding protein n=1 Tax=Myroides sp. WP-1 TaxID=2759944 RepID=UPI0015F7C01A|nr:tetratricopeptide repeat-containing sensor histidine kinase [Myroides sp. WP-1]MBB1137924.1 histidine kinase [Myroides sp. WP-1]
MKNNVLIYFLLFLALFSLLHCTPKHLNTPIDIDQLYAVQHDEQYKDSLAQTLAEPVQYALTLSNTASNRHVIDSTLQLLRWTLDSVNFRKLAQKSIAYATKKNDLSTLANTYNSIGMYYHDSYQLDSTFYYYIKTENVYKELQDSIKVGETKFYQARLLFEMGLNMESESKVSQALLLLNQAPYNPVNFEANQLMGLCLMERKNYTEAEVYLKTAVDQILLDLSKYKILDAKRAKMAIGNAYGNLAEVCYNQGKFNEAKAYVVEGQKYLEKDTPIMLVSFLRNRLAQCNYRLTGNSLYIKEVEQSFKDDSILGNSFRMFYTAMDLAHLYQLEDNQEVSNQWAEVAYTNASRHQVLPQQVQALEFLLTHEDYQKKDQVRQLIKLRQALTNQENQTRNTFARIAYETEVIEAENHKLRELIFTIILIGLSLLFILIISVFRFQLKIKDKELLLIKAQRKANESIDELIIERNLIARDIKKKERNRIAKNLHDGIVNSIFGIRFHLQLLDIPDIVTKNLLINELQKLESNTRDISHALLDNNLFVENQFKHLVSDLVSFQVNAWHTKFSVDYNAQINFEILDATTKTNLYYILREALQNINKYSKATRCYVSFTLIENDSKIKVTIQDNGIGFEEISSKGMGIANIFERAEQIKAEIHIDSALNKGTVINLYIPYFAP